MAERQPSRVQAASSRKRAPKVAKPADAAGVVARAPETGFPISTETDQPPVEAASGIAALEAERDRLRFELDAARERIALLESSRQEVLDRIAWVIDSLHSLDKD